HPTPRAPRLDDRGLPALVAPDVPDVQTGRGTRDVLDPRGALLIRPNAHLPRPRLALVPAQKPLVHAQLEALRGLRARTLELDRDQRARLELAAVDRVHKRPVELDGLAHRVQEAPLEGLALLRSRHARARRLRRPVRPRPAPRARARRRPGRSGRPPREGAPACRG